MSDRVTTHALAYESVTIEDSTVLAQARDGMDLRAPEFGEILWNENDSERVDLVSAIDSRPDAEPHAATDSEPVRALELVAQDLQSGGYAESPVWDLAVSLVRAAKTALSQIADAASGKSARDLLADFSVFLKRRGAKLAESNLVSAERLRIERRTGTLLALTVTPGNPQFSPGRRIGTLPAGISYNQSSAWQRLAQIPEEDFEHWLQVCLAGDLEITTDLALGYWSKHFAPPPPTPGSKTPSRAPEPPKSREESKPRSIVCPECGRIIELATVKDIDDQE